MDFLTTLKIVGIGSAVFMIGFVWLNMAAQGKREKEVAKVAADISTRALRKFPSYQGCLAVDGNGHCLFINKRTRMTLVATPEFAKEIPFDNYIAATIVTDGITAVETRKSGAAGRAIAGGLIGGGAGAIVGALSAKSVNTTVNVTTSISLIVETVDETFPAFGWNFFQPFGVMKDLKPYETWPYMNRATAAYNELALLFEMYATEQNGLVAI